MKQTIRNYAIDLSHKSITLNDFAAVYQDRLRLITDTTTNQLLYNFADASVASIVSLGTNAFYLNVLPASTATLDYLEIDYETLTGDPIYDGGQRTMASSQPVVLASNQSTVTVAAQQLGSPWGVNASIAGTVPVSGTFWQATQPISGNVGLSNASLTAFQGGAPWLTNASIVGTPGVTANLAANSTLTVYQGTNPWLTNASIVGTPGVNASIQGTVPVSGTFFQATQPVSGIPGTGATLTVYQATLPIPISGSFNLAAGSTVSANQIGNWTVGLAANSTVTAYQGNAPWAANVSVQGTALVAGNIGFVANTTLTAFQGGSPWGANVSVQGTVPVSGFPTAVNVSLLGPTVVTLAGNVSIGAITVNSNSSITAFQGGAPWLVNASIQGSVPVTGTFYQVNQPVTASIAGTVPVSGAFNVSLTGGVSLVGTPNVAFASGSTVTAIQGTNPWIVNATQAGAWTVALAASSTLTAYQGTSPWLVNASVVGQLAVTASLVGIPNVNASLVGAVTATLSGPVTLAGAVTLGGVNLNPGGFGGWTAYTNVNGLASTASISSTAGKFGGYMVANFASTPAYLEIFDTTGNVTLGFTAPNMIFAIPANPSMTLGLAANFELTNGSAIANGIKMAVVTAANNGTFVSLAMTGTLWYH